MLKRPLTLVVSLIVGLSPLLAQDARRPLKVEDGDQWRSIRGAALSTKGSWLTYGLAPAGGDDGVLEVVATEGERRFLVEGGKSARLDYAEGWLACLVAPKRDDLRAYRKAKKDKDKEKSKGESADEEPVDALAILDLSSGEQVEVARVRSFLMPEEAGGWIAYLKLKEPKEPKKSKKDAGEEPKEVLEGTPPAEETEAPPASEPAPEPSEEEVKGEKDEKKKYKPKDGKKDGTELVLRNLATGEEQSFANVVHYRFAKDGRHLAYVTSSKDEGGDGLYVVNLERGTPHAVLEGEGDYRSIAFDETSAQLTFLSNQADYTADQPKWTLYHSAEGGEAVALACAGTAGVPDGWGVSENRSPSFSESGHRILFGTAPLPEPKPEEIEEEDRVVLDIWSWTDDLIQPHQLKELERERKRSYRAVVHLGLTGARVVQLATLEIPDVRLGLQGDSRYALGVSDHRFRKATQWDTNIARDAWSIDVLSGETSELLRACPGRPGLSTGGDWVTWWDGAEREWFGVRSDGTGEARCLTSDIPTELWNELHDSPSLPRSYGSGGWLEGDAGLLIYDSHDLWLVDPEGYTAPFLVTEGVGRREGLRFRRLHMDPEEPSVVPTEELLLSAFHLKNKRAGFWRDRLIGGAEPTAILMGDKRYSTPVRAKEGDLLRFTQEDYLEYPDLWVADAGFKNPRKLSDANPQQEEFLWGSAELVDWRSTDGTPLQGVLYKPEGFDPERKYPLVVYFYERMSDGLHRHNTPVPSRSSVRFTYYTSNDYCVFVPDIPYRIGYPGESCASAVLPGILSLVDEGFIDPAAIGVQGHSWGGYQIAYLVTRTNLFAAAIAGAPVSNMTSAYGGIRWASGRSRQFQYEKSQSRLGGTLWEVPNRYFENSPLFTADKVETPLVMLHNDKDGAVPWYQGIEYFVALKRLNKPVWLLNYNGEGHGIGKYASRRDYAVRMSQFFDHYLRGAPSPVWMVDGVPALDKGRDLGLDLVQEER